MEDIHIALAGITSIILFIFGLENFSKEIQRITGEKFRKFLSHATSYPIASISIGAIITAFIQSSSATSIIAIGLVNAGVLSFKNSIGIIFGSNVGTTITAQLVAFKLTAFAPILIVSGFFLSFVKSKYSIFAKSLFYFGFVFYCLNLISSTLAPLQSDERLVSFLTGHQNPLIGVMIGFLITAVVQSSSVTTGLAIIFTQQGLISLENAIPILMGANIGTTVTALISIINMDIAAKKTALAHFLFNFGGVILFLPIVWYWGGDFPLMSDNPAIALANFHLIFNIVTSTIFALFINPFSALIDKIMGDGKMDFERLDLSYFSKSQEFEQVREHLITNLADTFSFSQENYNLITLSIETNYKGVYEAAKKRIEYSDYVKNEFLTFFSNFIGTCDNEEEIEDILKIVGIYEYIFQIHDSIKDITTIKESMDKNFIELKSDMLLIVRELFSSTLLFFDKVSKADFKEDKDYKKDINDFQKDLDRFNRSILKTMSEPERKDAATIFHLITYSQRLKDKLIHFNSLITKLKEND